MAERNIKCPPFRLIKYINHIYISRGTMKEVISIFENKELREQWYES